MKNTKTFEELQTLAENFEYSCFWNAIENFISRFDSRFTHDKAKSFMYWYKNQCEALNSEHWKNDFLKFKLFVAMCSTDAFYDWELEKWLREQLDYYVSTKKKEAKEAAENFYDEQRINWFTADLLNFYAGMATYNETYDKLTAWMSERYIKEQKMTKTLDKIKAKMQTKACTAEKIKKIISDDIEREYYKFYPLTNEQQKTYYTIMESHGFWY